MWYADFKVWLIIGLQVITVIGIMITKFNDLKHLEKDVKNIIVKTDKLIERVSKIEGKMEK